MESIYIARSLFQGVVPYLWRIKLGFIVLAIMAVPAIAETIYVSQSGNDANNGQIASMSVRTLKHGIELIVARGGGEIRVTPGLYKEASLQLSRGVTIISGSGKGAAPEIVYVSPDGDDNNNGQTAITSVRTLKKGIELIVARRGSEMRVATGLYNEGSLQLPDGVTIIGGWVETAYVSLKGDDKNNGVTHTTPFRTLSKGIDEIVARGGGEICVATGLYKEDPLLLPSGVMVSGGWDDHFEKQNLFTADQLEEINDIENIDTFCKDHTCITTNSGDYVITTFKKEEKIDNNAVPRGLTQLVILGPDRTQNVGSSSYGVIIDKPNVQLDFVIIKAGHGGPGAPGESPQPKNAYCTKGGLGGEISTEGRITLSCNYKNSQPGEHVYVDQVLVASGGEGGKNGDWCASFPSARDKDADDGNAGEKGSDGVPGKSGVAADNSQELNSFMRTENGLQWKSYPSGNGGVGSHGAGGGGGGVGGSWHYYFFPCLDSYVVEGGRGHVGNQGGCGGAGGGGGYSGGGAFALIIDNVNAKSEAIILVGGFGGIGGAGGKGAQGSVGETDNSFGERGTESGDCSGKPNPHRYGGRGGPGGHGGTGGSGAGGAGGNGGPAITLVKINNGDLDMGGSHIKRNLKGRGGSGGNGGATADGQVTAEYGKSGISKSEIMINIK